MHTNKYYGTKRFVNTRWLPNNQSGIINNCITHCSYMRLTISTKNLIFKKSIKKLKLKKIFIIFVDILLFCNF